MTPVSTDKGTLPPNYSPVRSSLSRLVVCAASLVGFGGCQGLHPAAALEMPQRGRGVVKSAPSVASSAGLLSVCDASDTLLNDRERHALSRYLTTLPSIRLDAATQDRLLLDGTLLPARQGVVFDRPYLIFVSWNEQGLIADRRITNRPKYSHTAAVAVRARVVATPRFGGGTDHDLLLTTSAINFIPDSVTAIREHVRILGQVRDRDGVSGKNWQDIRFLFDPLKSLGPDYPVTVSATRLVPAHKDIYRAFLAQASYLEQSCTRYHILAPFRAETSPPLANCQSALSGVKKFIPSKALDSGAPDTGIRRGKIATDEIARSLLDTAAICPAEGRFGSCREDWIGERFMAVLFGKDQSKVSWYTLQSDGRR